jgi:hypothetical protein
MTPDDIALSTAFESYRSGGYAFLVDLGHYSGLLEVHGSTVRYEFSPPDQLYADSREFPSETEAIRFANQFALAMKEARKSRSVPTSATFRGFQA